MSKRLMSPVSPFTLESLVASGQWTAAQSGRKKVAKADAPKKDTATSEKTAKTED